MSWETDPGPNATRRGPDQFTLATIGETTYLLRYGSAIAELLTGVDTDELLALLNPPPPAEPKPQGTKPPIKSWPSKGTTSRLLLDQWATGQHTVAEAVALAGSGKVSGQASLVAQAHRAGYLAPVGSRKPARARGVSATVYALTGAGLTARNERLAHEHELAARANRPAAEHYADQEPVATLSPDTAHRLETL